MDLIFHLLQRQLKTDIEAVVPSGTYADKLQAFEAEKEEIIQKIRDMKIESDGSVGNSSSLLGGARKRNVKRQTRKRRYIQ